MNFDEFKKLILSNSEQLAERSAYTDMQILSMELAKQSPSTDDVKNIKLLLTDLVSGDNLKELSSDQIAGLINFVNDSALGFQPDDVFYTKLKVFLENNFTSESDLLKRAYIIKLVTLINKNEYSPERFERTEGKISENYPWLYADIIAQSGNMIHLKDFLLELLKRVEKKDETFATLVNHINLWWTKQILTRNNYTTVFLNDILCKVKKMPIDPVLIDYLVQWAFENDLIGKEREPVDDKIEKLILGINSSINRAKHSLLFEQPSYSQKKQPAYA